MNLNNLSSNRNDNIGGRCVSILSWAKPFKADCLTLSLAAKYKTRENTLVSSHYERWSIFMKRYGHLWEQICSKENLEEALRLALRRKKKSKCALKVVANKDYYLDKLHVMLRNGEYSPSKYRIKLLFEPKLRIIYAAPFFPDRIVHHAIMNVLSPIYDSLMYDYSYSCRKGKGQHAASRKCIEYARRYKYCLQCDCSQFYINLDHELLHKMYRWKIKDTKVLNTLDNILDSTATRQNNIRVLSKLIENGVAKEQAEIQLEKLTKANTLFNNSKAGEPIGNLLSQWDGNLFMTPFDYYVKEQLKCKAYIRFCDDFLLFSDSKRQLQEWSYLIKSFLLERKVLLSKTAVFPTTQGVDFCGYRHFHNNVVLLRKRTAVSIKRRVHSIENGTSQKSPINVLGSLYGVMKHAKTYNLRKAINFDSLFERVRAENAKIL